MSRRIFERDLLLTSHRYVYNGQYVLPADWQSAFNVMGTPGQFFGGFLCSYIAERWGRKSALVGAMLFCTGGIVGQMVSTTRVAFLMSKLVLGFGLGFYLTIGPMMTSELTPVVLRGMATAGVNLGIAIGQLLSNAVVAGFGERTDRWAYRAPFAFQLTFVAFLLVGYPFAPESPIFLVKKGRTADAEKVLRQIWGDKIDIAAKMTALQKTISEETAGNGEVSFRDCFRGTNLKRTMISMMVFVNQHLVGKWPLMLLVRCDSLTSLRHYFRPRLQLLLFSACRPRCFGFLQSGCRCYGMRCDWQFAQLVRHQLSRTEAHVRLGHGCFDGHVASHRHS